MPSSIKDTVVVREFNDFEGLEDAFRRHGDELAALILEPVCHAVGVLEPEDGFLQLCRDLCTASGTVLIFDEVITGFRHSPGGVQELVGITPDLTAMGKAVANGFPLSLVAGKKEFMAQLAPEGKTFFSGTFNGQILTVVAGLACTDILVRDDVHTHLNMLGARLRDGIDEHIQHLGVRAQVAQRGSIWCIYFTDQPLHRFREMAEFTKDKLHPLQRAFQRWMLGRGFYIHPTYSLRAFISAAHTEEDIDLTIAAVGDFLREYREDLT
jgi:glutamate-1-semialdehyde 2,1-aminomutase